MAFTYYQASGPTLLTNPAEKLVGQFTLSNTSTTVANTLRRAILTGTSSVSFRADLTNPSDPGITITKNTSAVFNEMLAHRLTLLPIAIPEAEVDDYTFTLHVVNDTHTVKHITAQDFTVTKGGEPIPSKQVFPADPITSQASLLVSLRPQWNPEQPPEEIELMARPVVGTGKENMGFCPVSQCSFMNTIDTDPVTQDQHYTEWLLAFKNGVADPSHRQEWENMSIQRCFLKDEKGEPNSFDFTVESVGIRPVKEIVAEGIQAVIALVSEYAENPRITFTDPNSRMNGVDVLFEDQEHTLGNLLQTIITDLYLSDAQSPDTHVNYVGYKVPHPLHRTMTLRIGFIADTADMEGLARAVVMRAATEAKAIFEKLAEAWGSV
jgi:DNA-directed RNA polymerase subunit L